MTAITTLAGLLPLLVTNRAEANNPQSLGTLIIEGLVAATMLLLRVASPVYVTSENVVTRNYYQNQWLSCTL